MRRETGAAVGEALKTQSAEERASIQSYRNLCDRLRDLRDACELDVSGTIKCTSELLLMNPELMTAWNTRRKALRVLLMADE